LDVLSVLSLGFPSRFAPVREPVKVEPFGSFFAAAIIDVAAPGVALEPLFLFSRYGKGFVPRPDWVEMDIGNQFDGIGVGVDEMGFVPTLKKVPAAFVFPVVPAGVGGLKPGHGLRKIASGGLQNHVIVVGHQAVAVEDDCKLLEHLDEGLKKEFPILIAPEDFFSFVATTAGMVVSPFKFYPHLPRHSSLVSEVRSICPVSWTDPVSSVVD